MDPTKQEGQNPDNVGVGRQAIFTPQPPEPTTPDNNSGNSATQQTTNVNLSHPYFSNHPTQTQSVETGDIVINNAPAKSPHNKRPFIIGGIVLTITVVLIVVFAITKSLSGITNPTSVSSNATKISQQYFIKSSSYLLYGDANNEINGDYGATRAYELDYQFEKSEDDKYWQNVLDNLGLSISTLANSSNANEDSYQDLISYLELQKSNIVFLSQYYKFNEPNDEELFKIFLNDGINATNEYIDNLYADFDASQIENHAQYFENRQKYLHSLVDLYNLYRAGGCVREQEINVTCADAIDSTDNGSKLIDTLAESSNLFENYAWLLARRTENNCWIINSSFTDLNQVGDNDEY